MKPWYESKTIWVNVLTLVAVIIASVSNWPELQQYGAQLATALAVVNVCLRLITHEGITNDPQQGA